MKQDVFIIGSTGGVGKMLVEEICYSGDLNEEEHVNPTRIVGLANSRYFIYKPEGLNFREANNFSKGYCWRKYFSLENVIGEVKKGKHEQLIFVDVTPSSGMLDFHRKIIEETPYCIVTANKKPLVECNFETFKKLTRDVGRYGYRPSVMAGADVVTKIRDLRDLRDGLVGIEACLSGTIGFVEKKIEEGVKLSEAVKEARELKYTEPNPAEDLNGEDVARKLLILVRSHGIDAKLENIKLEPFVPLENLEGRDLNELFGNIEKLDENYAKIFEGARKEGKRMKYVAKFNWYSGGDVEMSVGLRKIDSKSPLFNIKGRMNKVAIRSETYTEPYCIEALGAGVAITAQNIRREIADLAKNRIVSY